jgi:dCMP deaminase
VVAGVTSVFNERWLRHFMDHATIAASMSKDPYTKVGCVLAKSRKKWCEGYNGPPYKMDREEKNRRSIHAEVNAILHATFETEGSIMVVTHHPCHACAIVIAQAGVERVYYSEYPEHNEWRASCGRAKVYLEECGVQVVKLC